MNYLVPLKLHYKPKKGWMNDPNGLVYFDGYYHAFYQHSPNYEVPWKEPMHWGHARTRDFIEWEELPIAIAPDKPYDDGGCWSGTAIVKDGVLYLFYASVHYIAHKTETTPEVRVETVSIAYSRDGINFEKYENNPVIDRYHPDGGPDFRDPAVTKVDGKYYCVMATGNPEKQLAMLLLYESKDLLRWEYRGVMSSWDNGKFAECPSFMEAGDGRHLLTASVCKTDHRYFAAMYGKFVDGVFTPEVSENVDKGPDQYAGQVFRDEKGRNILITWIPGWRYKGYAERDVGCLSVPREMTERDGKVYAYPVKELWQYLKDSDEALVRTEDGFVVKREGREAVVHKGEISDLKIIRDEYIMEIFVNGGETVYSILL